MVDVRETGIALSDYETKRNHTRFTVFSGHLDSCSHDKVIQGFIFQPHGDV
jgi:hypothetical protein